MSTEVMSAVELMLADFFSLSWKFTDGSRKRLLARSEMSKGNF